jgi:hypothetical protein
MPVALEIEPVFGSSRSPFTEGDGVIEGEADGLTESVFAEGEVTLDPYFCSKK